MKLPALQQPWELEILGLVLFTEPLHNCKAEKEVKTPVASFGKAVLILYAVSWLLCVLFYTRHIT